MNCFCALKKIFKICDDVENDYQAPQAVIKIWEICEGVLYKEYKKDKKELSKIKLRGGAIHD